MKAPPSWSLPLVAGALLGCAATLLGFLGRWSWVFDGLSHFRVQYGVGLVLVGVVLAIARRRRVARACFACAVANVCTVLPLYLGSPTTPPAGAHVVRTLLLNVNSHRGDPRRVLEAIRATDPDVVVLEELSARWIEALAPLSATYPHTCVQPRADNFGIGLFSKLPLAHARVVSIGAAGVPSLVATLETLDGPVAMVATHPLPPIGAAYWRLRNEQLERLPDYLPDSGPVLVFGDLNVTPWSYPFGRLLRRTGLRDSSQGRGVQATWPSDQPLLRIPLDHCLHSSAITIVAKSVGSDVGSDHYPVVVDWAIVPRRGLPHAPSS